MWIDQETKWCMQCRRQSCLDIKIFSVKLGIKDGQEEAYIAYISSNPKICGQKGGWLWCNKGFLKRVADSLITVALGLALRAFCRWSDIEFDSASLIHACVTNALTLLGMLLLSTLNWLRLASGLGMTKKLMLFIGVCLRSVDTNSVSNGFSTVWKQHVKMMGHATLGI